MRLPPTPGTQRESYYTLWLVSWSRTLYRFHPSEAWPWGATRLPVAADTQHKCVCCLNSQLAVEFAQVPFLNRSRLQGAQGLPQQQARSASFF